MLHSSKSIESKIPELESGFASQFVLDFWKVTEPFCALSFLICVIFNYEIITILELLWMHSVLLLVW